MEKCLKDTVPLHLVDTEQCHRVMELLPLMERLLLLLTVLLLLLLMERLLLPLTEQPHRVMELLLHLPTEPLPLPLTEQCPKVMELLPPTEPLPPLLMAQLNKDTLLHRNPPTQS